MSTIILSCPRCGSHIRSAVQVAKAEAMDEHVLVTFDTQAVAHVCSSLDLAIVKRMEMTGETRGVAFMRVTAERKAASGESSGN